jgi:solute:Na+ symporter, SSS family
MSGLRPIELLVLGLSLCVVTILGLLAREWRRPAALNRLEEWGLGGRQHGSWVSWFVLGATLFTGYLLVAAPALAFSEGASAFVVLPYLIVAFPLMMLPLTRLWSVSRARGYLTTADFVRGRYGSPALTLLTALTGLAVTVPYLGLQFVAIESVTRTAGLNQPGMLGHLPLLVPFAVLVLLTTRSGLRAPTLVSFIKIILSYLVAFVAILYLPIKLDGWVEIFKFVEEKFQASPSGGILLDPADHLHYATLALGSALALFLYPHAITSVLACGNRAVIKRNMPALQINTVLVWVLLMLGYVAIAAAVVPLTNASTGQPDANTVIPLLFADQSPPWFAGLAFAAITISALVPAAVLAIGAANLWARSIYRHYLRRTATPEQESRQARIAAAVVLAAGLVLAVALDPEYAYELQLIGGVAILQTLPAVLIPLYGRWLHVYGLVLGWFAGIGAAGYLLYGIVDPDTGRRFAGTAYPLSELRVLDSQPFPGSDLTVYAGLVALAANLAVAVLVTVVVRAVRIRNGRDETRAADYETDTYDPDHRPIGVPG